MARSMTEKWFEALRPVVCPEESCDLPDAEDARLGFLFDFLCITQAIVCYIFRANSNE